MRVHALAIGVTLAAFGTLAGGQEADVARLNPIIGLLEQGRPVFGLYAPRVERRDAEGRAARTPRHRATETLAYRRSDFVFDGSMEDGLAPAWPPFLDFVAALGSAGGRAAVHPLVVKTPPIAADPDLATLNIGRQLNAGASGVVFVHAESAEEVRHGLSAMRFAAHGGTRPADVGDAPAYWGLSDAQYRERADLWPLNPRGELINWTIVESRRGLANLRAIAAVEGIGVLWPGAGTLRGVFTTTGPDGAAVFDAEGWEAAIQDVLAACKAFDVPCGYPASAGDIERRLQQGFSVFVMGWGEDGFETVDIGRRLSGRAESP